MKNMIAKMMLIGVCCLSFSACQSTSKHLVSKQVLPNNSTVKLSCDGARKCEFERVNQVRIVSEKTHSVDYDAIQKGYVRLQLISTVESNHLYLTIPAQQQEVVIRFYPISLDRAEKVNIIHQFKPNQTYTFSMYRDRIKRENNLLSLSTPDPLCVKFSEGKHVIRRFCKAYNVLTGLGEFVEQKNDFKSYKN